MGVVGWVAFVYALLLAPATVLCAAMFKVAKLSARHENSSDVGLGGSTLYGTEPRIRARTGAIATGRA